MTAGVQHQEAERRHLTVMFCDLVESTAMSTRLDPEDLRDVVAEFQRVANDVVVEYSGHIAQYLGDGLLIYFGYPKAHEDDPTRAARAGLRILEATTRLSESLQAKQNLVLDVRIGVHSGLVVTGEVGSGTTVEHLAIGSVPNIAARAQSLANPGDMLITGDVRGLLQPDISCEAVGERELRGIASPIALYRVTGVAPSAERSRNPERAPYVGRDQEVSTILQCYASANRKRGQLVLLSGEPGIGKSRLCREIIRSVGGSTSVRVYRCAAYHRNTPFYPIIEGLNQEFQLDETDPDDLYLDKLARGLARAHVSGEKDVRLFAEFLTGRPSLMTPGSVAVKRRAMAQLVANVLLNLAANAHHVLIIEDLHWADPSTVEFAQQIAEVGAGSPVLTIYSFRPSFATGWTIRPHHTQINLKPLSAVEALELVRETSDFELSPRISEQVLDRADGVPLFIEEICRSLEGIDVRAQNDADLPNSLRDLLSARLDSLGPAKAVVQLGALIGRRFGFELVASITDLDHDQLKKGLALAIENGLLFESGSAADVEYVFRHALIQEAAYDSLLKRHRRELHGAVADVLTPDTMTAKRHPELVAMHCERAGRFEAAVHSYRLAGRSSTLRSSYVEALHFLTRAVELASKIEASPERDLLEYKLLLERAQMLIAVQGYTDPQLVVTYERARHILEVESVDVDAFGFYASYWGLHAVKCNVVEAERAAQALRKAAQASGPNAHRHAITSFALGCNAFYAGRISEAGPHLREAADYYRANRENLITGDILYISPMVYAWCMGLNGDVDRALAEIAEVIDWAETSEDPFMLAQALCYCCVIYQDLSLDLERILELADKAYHVAKEYGFQEWIGYARMHMAYVNACRGDHQSAQDMRDIIESLYDGSSDNSWAHSLYALADAQMRLEDYELALETVNKSIQICKEEIGRYIEAECHRLRGELLIALGLRNEGLECLRSACEMARRDGATYLEIKAVNSLAEQLRKQGRLTEADALLASSPFSSATDVTPDKLRANILANPPATES